MESGVEPAAKFAAGFYFAFCSIHPTVPEYTNNLKYEYQNLSEFNIPFYFGDSLRTPAFGSDNSKLILTGKLSVSLSPLRKQELA